MIASQMQEQGGRVRLFCADSTPLQPKDYIFDSTYRNIGQKKKFQRDPKFAYFNALVKMKNNYLQNKKDVYKYVFGTQDGANESKIKQSMQNNNQQMISLGQSPRTTFHVEKINNHSFKIFKGKGSSLLTNSHHSENIDSLNDVNFKVHFRKIPKKQSKSQFMSLLKEYRKVQNNKSSIDPEGELNRTKTSTLRKKSIQLTFYNEKIRNHSFQKLQSLKHQRKVSHHFQRFPQRAGK